jgi:hypothetical protein
MTDPYVFAIREDEYFAGPESHDEVLADRLREAGYDIGPTLWTGHSGALSSRRVWEHWQEAFKRAKITRVQTGRDEAKGRTWFKVWPRPETIQTDKNGTQY